MLPDGAPPLWGDWGGLGIPKTAGQKDPGCQAVSEPVGIFTGGSPSADTKDDGGACLVRHVSSATGADSG